MVIPAHNEASVIDRCLRSLARGVTADQFRIHVICNGSTDGTAGVARATGSDLGLSVSVHELPRPSKTAALRHSSSVVSGVPRIFLDADVEMAGSVAMQLTRLLAQEAEPRVASPSIEVDLTESPWMVRAWFRTWLTIPYVRNGLIGSGVYAVNGPGLLRIKDFPELLNDDAWVAAAFDRGERLVGVGSFRIRAPRSTAALIRRRARVLLGNKELSHVVRRPPGEDRTGSAVVLRNGGVGLADRAAFLVVTVSAKALAGWRMATGRRRLWSTDMTSRTS